LNHKPDADHLWAVTWYSPSFSHFFKGRSTPMSGTLDMSRERLRRLCPVDYLLIYVQQWQRQIPEPLLDYLKTQTPEHTIRINGLDYVQIYRRSDLPAVDAVCHPVPAGG
jgi:hypothetical protein